MQENPQSKEFLENLIDQIAEQEQWFENLAADQENLLKAIFALSLKENPKDYFDQLQLINRSRMSWN